MSAGALELIVPVPAGEDCAGCGTAMVLTPDAIGRLRKRCPKCDGISRKRLRHPDDVMMPQGLVRSNVLPAIEPGQLRCQRCARGVDGSARFCVSCVAWREQEEAARKVRTCLGCGRRSPRGGGLATSATCPACAPTGTSAARVYKTKPCAWDGCGAVFQPSGPRSRYCEAHQ